jgi:hypothetical protein
VISHRDRELSAGPLPVGLTVPRWLWRIVSGTGLRGSTAMEKARRPLARSAGLLVEPIGDELLVFDSERKVAHSLNDVAARVWRACDGAARH